MEYLASKAYHFSVWSSDPQLLTGTNLTIRAHAKCSVLRLKQYIHHLLVQQQGVGTKFSVNDLTLVYKTGELDGELQCQQIEPNYPGVIRLRLEKSNKAVSLQPTYYNPDSFTRTMVQSQCNILSVEKIFKARLQDVSLHSTISHLAKLTIEELNQYERQNEDEQMCSVKEHTLDDVIALDIAGRSHPINLSETTEDLTLSDLLGIDFVPTTNGYCSLLCKVRHSQMEEGVTIEFVSEAKFTIQQMIVNSKTTVLDVKNFICSVYAHALRLQPSDIKLIYKGCIIHELNGASNEPNKILKFITKPNGAKLHVHISHEYSEPGPGFWSELLFAPDRFDFMPTRTQSQDSSNSNSNSNSNGDSVIAALSGSLTGSAPMRATDSTDTHSQRHTAPVSYSNTRSVTPSPTPTRTVDAILETHQQPVQVLTSEGLPVSRSYETYERVTVNNKDYIVPRSQLETQYFELQIGDRIIKLCPDEVHFQGGYVHLTASARASIENAIGERITNGEYLGNIVEDEGLLPDTPATPNNGGGQQEADGERHRGGVGRLPNMFNFLRRMNMGRFFRRETLVLIIEMITGRNGLLMSLGFGLYLRLPLWAFCLLVTALTIRSVWIKFKLSKKVRKLVVGSADSLTTQEQEQIRTLIKSEKFNAAFFMSLARMRTILPLLCSRMDANQDLANELLHEVKRNPKVNQQLAENDRLASHSSYVLKQFLLSLPSRERAKPIFYELFRDLLEKCEPLLSQEMHTLEPWAAAMVHEMRKYNWRVNRSHMTASDYIKLWLDIYEPWNFFSNTQFMRYAVPDPRTDNILVGIVKNCLLFVLLFIPSFERQFEEIIEERLIQQSQDEDLIAL